MIARHQKIMRHGWCIPQIMEWLFWPIGQPVPLVENQTVGLIQRGLASRFKLTNHEPFMEQLRRLGVVKEAKP